MDTNEITVDVEVEEFGLGHQVGRTVVSSVAGFGAARLSEKLYDHVVRTIRARRGS